MASCHHCGYVDVPTPDPAGDHTCTCPNTDEACQDHPLPLDERRRRDGRCTQCGNWPTVCGHGLPFKERMKTVRANYIGWSETR